MKSTTRRTNPRYYNYIGIAMIIAIGLLVYRGYHNRQRQAHAFVVLEAKPIKSSYGWGYEILADGKVYIHQEFIPAIPGKKGFATQEQAIAVGNKVIMKIKNKQIPPALTVDELKDLGVLPDSFAHK